MIVEIQFDGGCIGNPGQKYGSFKAKLDDKPLAEELRIKFGHGTNNEAEFNALMMALDITDYELERLKINPKDCDLKVITDSKIVRNRLMVKNVIYTKPAWIEGSKRMFSLASDCLVYMKKFARFNVEWESRESNVKMFGH